jgi:hypothetical protein
MARVDIGMQLAAQRVKLALQRGGIDIQFSWQAEK